MPTINHFRDRARHYAERFLLALVRVEGALRPTATPWVLLVPPADPGSLGDDAMVSATIGLLHETDVIVDIAFQNGWPERRFTAKSDHVLNFTHFFRRRTGSDTLQFFRGLRRFSHCLIVGADVLDGHYDEAVSLRKLELAELAARAGLKVTLLGFSFNETPKPRTVEALSRLAPRVRVCARDPVSAQRLRKTTGHAPISVADVAFLLRPSQPQSPALIAWLDQAQQQGSEIVGLNALCSKAFIQVAGGELCQSIRAFYLALIERISEQDCDIRFLFISHDYRDHASETPFMREIYEACAPSIRERSYFISDELTAAEVKHVCGRLSFVVTGRMHLAIASLGRTTPVFGFGYQGKFEGLADLFGMPDMIASPEEMKQQPQHLLTRIIEQFAGRRQLRRRIAERLPGVLSLARKNFAPFRI